MICVSLCAKSGSEVKDRMRDARRAGADLVEVRADFLEDLQEIETILMGKPLPVLVTLRSEREGGRFSGTDEELFSFLRDAAALGADWVDVEWKRYRPFEIGKSRLVLSWHDPEKTPLDLREVCSQMQSIGADLVKIAVHAKGVKDLLCLLALQKEESGDVTCIAMGEYGEALRILYSRFGGGITFVSLERGSETAAGQLSISEMVKAYRVRSIDEKTLLYGVVGSPVSHSRSPEIFNQIFHHLGLNARYLRLPLDDPSLFQPLVEALPLAGVSITLPHKEALVSALDEADPSVSEMGAVNTAVIQEKRIFGFNTDAPGAVEVVREAAIRRWSHGLYGMKVLVLGAGGVARAIAWGLRKEGAQITIANRTLDRAKRLASDLRCDATPWEERGNIFPHVVVNATRVGMGGEGTPFPDDRWRPEMIALDAVYTPRWTPFLKAAKSAGAFTVDGVALFLRQANLQCRHFLGRAIPTELRRRFESV